MQKRANKFVLSLVLEMIYKQSTHFLTWGRDFLGGKTGTEHGIWAPPGTTTLKRQRECPGVGAAGRTHQERWVRPGKLRLPPSSWLRCDLCLDSLALKHHQPTARANGIFDSSPLDFSPFLSGNFQKFSYLLMALEKHTDRVLNLKNVLGNTKERGVVWKVLLFFRNKINYSLLKNNK